MHNNLHVRRMFFLCANDCEVHGFHVFVMQLAIEVLR